MKKEATNLKARRGLCEALEEGKDRGKRCNYVMISKTEKK